MIKKVTTGLALALVLLAGCTKKEIQSNATVNLAIWSNYVSQEALSDFEKRTGVKVIVSNYSSNEELLAKLQAGAAGYDVAVPSDYMVFAMIQLNLLEKLDATQIQFPKSMDPKLAKPGYDPDHTYSAPYDWGTTGIAVRRDLYDGTVRGWKDLFGSAALKGKFSLLDDARETLGASLKSLGFSLNSEDPAQLAQAQAQLIKIRKNIKAFTSEPKAALLSGETPVAHIYSSDALQARRELGSKVEYIVPIEGGTFWVDNLVIPKGAKNTKQAHQLISFLLEAKTVAKTVESIWVAPSNLDAVALLPPEYRSNLGLFPPTEILGRLEMMRDLGKKSELFDRAWTEIKAH